MAGLQSDESRMMIDSVVWAQHIEVIDTQTATQPRRDSNSRTNELRSGGKSWTLQFLEHSVELTGSQSSSGCPL